MNPPAAILGAALATLTPRPVLFTSDPAGPGAASSAAPPPTPLVIDAFTLSPWLIALLCGLVALAVVASVAISRLAWRGGWREPPEARAAARLARELGLDAGAMSTLRRLADALGVPPVALLLSESAFERAAEAIETGPEPPGPPGALGRFRRPDALPPAEKAALLALRARIFGESTATADRSRHAPVHEARAAA